MNKLNDRTNIIKVTFPFENSDVRVRGLCEKERIISICRSQKFTANCTHAQR